MSVFCPGLRLALTDQWYQAQGLSAGLMLAACQLWPPSAETCTLVIGAVPSLNATPVISTPPLPGLSSGRGEKITLLIWCA